MKRGYIALWRKLIDWEWYHDLPVRVLFIHLLLVATHKPINHAGLKLRRGQYVTSIRQMSKQAGLSVRQVRTALDKLKSTGEISTQRATQKLTVLTLCNYDEYQTRKERGDTQGDKRATQEQPHNKEKKYMYKSRPAWFPVELWEPFIDNRVFKKLQNTELALTTICNAIKKGVDAGHTVEDCVNEYIASRWTRFDHEWLKTTEKKQNGNDRRPTAGQAAAKRFLENQARKQAQG